MSRPTPPFTGDERGVLEGFLDFHRETLIMKCADLDAAQLAARSCPPSTLSLLGLLRHLADVEQSWFDRVEGRQRPPRFFTEDDLELDFTGAAADPALVDEAFAAWRASVHEAREVVATHDLDATFVHPKHGEVSLRWVLMHLVEEYARHNGHADLLREAVDGRTGE